MTRYYECPHCGYISDHVDYTETRLEWGTAGIGDGYFEGQDVDDSETEDTHFKCSHCEHELRFDEEQVRDSDEEDAERTPLDMNDNSENIWRVQ